jgi:hypothetical protein
MRLSKELTIEERAYHEAGHVTVGYYFKIPFAEVKLYEMGMQKEVKLSEEMIMFIGGEVNSTDEYSSLELFSNPSLLCQFAIYLLSGYEAQKKYNPKADFESIFGDYLQAKNVITHNLNFYGFDESDSEKLGDQILVAYRYSSKEIIESLWPVITKVANVLLENKILSFVELKEIIMIHGTKQIKKDFNNLFYDAVKNYNKINLKLLEKYNIDIQTKNLKTDFGEK